MAPPMPPQSNIDSESQGSSRYSQRGVSSFKVDVHKAIQQTDAGLYPGAFCKIIPDVLGGSEDHCSVVHADGAGSKSAMAYLYWKETGDASVFKGIAQDSIVMNVDDILCVGGLGPYLLSSIVGRNAKVVGPEVIEALITGAEQLSGLMKNEWNMDLIPTGGETADNGDVVRTVDVNSTISTRLRRDEVIDCARISPGNVIIGLSSTGQATYESRPNSGIGSNGLTMARHELLHNIYLYRYPESCQEKDRIESGLLYSGEFDLLDPLPGDSAMTIGEALLSPTRSYSPIIGAILSDKETRKLVTGIIHCSGGGQVKCLRFGRGVQYHKHSLFDCPPLFEAIWEAGRKDAGSKHTRINAGDKSSRGEDVITWEEMYRVFNMGHRMEIIGEPSLFPKVKEVADRFNVGCKIVGNVLPTTHSDGVSNEVIIEARGEKIHYV